jgi:urease accessory protein
MIRAIRVAEAGSGKPVDAVLLDHDARHRRRVAMKGEEGVEFLLDLPEARALRDGDLLALEDGRLVEVKAAFEPLTRVIARDPGHLVRIAWHLGNRHLPAQFGPDFIFIRRDHVIEDMLRGLGGTVLHVRAPFEPEGGAYAHGGHEHHRHQHHDHGHHDHEHHDHEHHGHEHHGHEHHGHDHDDHGHDHGHDHHQHDHDHGHGRPGHERGPGHRHSHD